MKQSLREKIKSALKKRNEQFLSKFEFSISFRIGINYARYFLLYGMVFLMCFIVMFIYVESYEKTESASNYLQIMETEGGFDPDYAEGYFKGIGVTMKVTDPKGTVLIDNTEGRSAYRYFADLVSYRQQERSLTLKSRREIAQSDGNILDFTLFINLDESEHQLRKIMLPLCIMMLVMLVLIIRSCNKDNVHLMEPIKSMSQTANRLTVNSLSQERLNVEGTSDELKELAETINEMLDRLDMSYESQKQFVSDASHELRTPIAVIQGYINMLDRWGKKDEKVMEESIEAIKNEAQSMQELVEKLLFLSRHDKKTMKLKKKFFEMSEVVDDMVKETELVAKDRRVVCEGLDKVMVYGDNQALKQAVRVFIENAIKYTKDGDTIAISCRNKHGDCIICIRDTGIGMTQEDVDHIFERFYRSDNVRNEKIEGHGLGLSIAKLIITKHSGRIRVTSQFTVGTEFVIIIPKFKLW